MGQAKRRGSFEERKHQSITKKEEQCRIDHEAYLKLKAERDALMDQRDRARANNTYSKPSKYSSGFSNRRSSVLMMGAMLAAFAGMDTGYRR